MLLPQEVGLNCIWGGHVAIAHSTLLDGDKKIKTHAFDTYARSLEESDALRGSSVWVLCVRKRSFSSSSIVLGVSHVSPALA
jgi:hypothetical protein